VSSSGTSTTTARSLAAGAGTGGTVGVVVAVVVTVDAAAASCCYPATTSVSRGGSVTATALPADRGALDESRLVGMDTSDLIALAIAREGTVGATLRTRTRDQSSAPQNRGRLERTLPTSNLRSPTSSSSGFRGLLP
jgi:hypothetical protein